MSRRAPVRTQIWVGPSEHKYVYACAMRERESERERKEVEREESDRERSEKSAKERERDSSAHFPHRLRHATQNDVTSCDRPRVPRQRQRQQRYLTPLKWRLPKKRCAETRGGREGASWASRTTCSSQGYGYGMVVCVCVRVCVCVYVRVCTTAIAVQ